MERKVITVSGILEDLANGLKRKEIKEKYGLTLKETTELFKHERLKGRKAVKQVSFTLVDDTVSPISEGQRQEVSGAIIGSGEEITEEVREEVKITPKKKVVEEEVDENPFI